MNERVDYPNKSSVASCKRKIILLKYLNLNEHWWSISSDPACQMGLNVCNQAKPRDFILYLVYMCSPPMSVKPYQCGGKYEGMIFVYASFEVQRKPEKQNIISYT